MVKEMVMVYIPESEIVRHEHNFSVKKSKNY